MRKDSLWIVIATWMTIIVSFFSFTIALAYLHIPKEIVIPEKIEIPTTEEIHTTEEIEIPTKKIEIKELSKVQESQKVENKKVKETKKEETKKMVSSFSSIIKSWKGTRTAKIAIILDDAGYSINGFVKKLFEIQEPLTFSVLPGITYSKEIANIAHKKGFEIMLHMPMEYCGNSKMTQEDKLCEANHNMNTYKYALLSGMSKEQIEEELENAVNDIPFVVGINNHMGSKATADEVTMSYVLDKIKSKNLYFIDSLTTSRSVGYKMAKRKGIPCNKRTVFLDNINDTEYVKERLMELIAIAKRKGYAIGIGHATKRATANALAEIVPKLKDYNIEVVPVSKLVN